MKTTKKEKVRQHLILHGSITPMEAYELYKSMRLSAIIFELRGEGMNISTLYGKTNAGSVYAIYCLHMGEGE